MNVLVCGTRESLTAEQQRIVRERLAELRGKDILVIDGMAWGVDSYAHFFARAKGWGWRRFPADWKRFGKRAGPRRNQEMLDKMKEEGHPVDLVLAFPIDSSQGTWDMVERAVKNRIPVRVYPL